MQRIAIFNLAIVLAANFFYVSAFAQPLTPERERMLKPNDSFKECEQCPELVVVPSGSFLMGSQDSGRGNSKAESPQHQVTITKPFAVGKFEVIVDQFASFVADSGYDTGSKCWTLEDSKAEERSGRSWRNPGFAQGVTHPVVCVNWNDAKAYVAWLSKKTGKTYRLLTEAEWEYAERAGTTTRYSFGDDVNEWCRNANGGDQTAKSTIPGVKHWAMASCNDGYAYTAPVGSFPANAFGLHDMHGNVWEWTEDCYVDSYAGAPTDGTAWAAGDCSKHARRGGSWLTPSWVLYSAYRNWLKAGSRDATIGFRVGRTLSPTP